MSDEADFTDARQEAADSEELQQKYELVTRASTDAFWDWDPTTDEISRSDEYLTQFGYAAADVAADTDWWRQRIHPEDRDRVLTALEQAVSTPDATYDETYRFRMKDGSYGYVRSRGYVVYDEAGTPERMVGAHIDITDRKEREARLEETTARLEALYENSPDMIDVLDPDGTLVDVNRRFCEELGYTEDALLDRPIWEIDRLVDADDVRTLLSELAVGERRKFEGLYERSDGSTLPVEVHLLRLALDGADRYLAISRDITERKAYEEALERQNDRLDDFASIVSHDLRNPLNVAHGRLELGQAECDSEQLDHVERALDRMSALIDDLLTLARQGERVSELEPVDLASLCATCWRNVETGGATLVTDTDVTIQADRTRLLQLLENLFRNAVEHGGDRVTVTVGELDEATGFYVADDGPGIPVDEREQVFERGYSTALQGTGFGLAIVKEIVVAHDWEIRVTDSDEGGTRFEITGVAV